MSLAMDIFFRRNTSGVTRVSDTYFCMMLYEQKLQQQAGVSAGLIPSLSVDDEAIPVDNPVGAGARDPPFCSRSRSPPG